MLRGSYGAPGGDSGNRLFRPVFVSFVVVAAVAATRFGGVDVGLAYDVLTWTVARGLAWVALAAALVVAGLAFRDLKGRGLYAVAALVMAGAAVAVPAPTEVPSPEEDAE